MDSCIVELKWTHPGGSGGSKINSGTLILNLQTVRATCEQPSFSSDEVQYNLEPELASGLMGTAKGLSSQGTIRKDAFDETSQCVSMKRTRDFLSMKRRSTN